MKRTLWSVTLSSIITLGAYIALYAIWGAILSELKNPMIKNFFIASMTTAAFGFFLLYISKIKKNLGEDEVLADYNERKYVSLFNDFKLVIRRESKTLSCIAAIIFVCFALNTFDSLVFQRKVVSFPTFFFAPMCLFETLINIPFVGYAISALLDCTVYILFLLIYRRKRYNYWMKIKE